MDEQKDKGGKDAFVHAKAWLEERETDSILKAKRNVCSSFLVAPRATATTSRRLSREPILRARRLAFLPGFMIADGPVQDTFKRKIRDFSCTFYFYSKLIGRAARMPTFDLAKYLTIRSVSRSKLLLVVVAGSGGKNRVVQGGNMGASTVNECLSVPVTLPRP